MSDELIEKCTKVLKDYREQVEGIYQSVLGKVIVKKADKSNGCSCSFVIKEETQNGLELDPLDRRVRLEHYTLCDHCKNLQQKGVTLRDIINAIASGVGEIDIIDSIKAGEEK